MSRSVTYWAPLARLGQPPGWARDVLLRADASGHWAEVAAGVPAPEGARLLPGPALPGVVDAHGHAFQRAFAGLAERREGERDDFWSWREQMYRVASRMTPEALRAIATQLFVELLCGGYTHVCEFHYLHRLAGAEGDPSVSAHAIVGAAAESRIGLTLLPVLYERAGFAASAPEGEQRRFAIGLAGVDEIRAAIECEGRVRGRSLLGAGLACHSLRAVSEEGIAGMRRLAAAAGDAPIHIHLAEQVREVEECERALGQRPVAWLAGAGLDRNWHLVHATHVTPREIEAVARGGATVVLCPGTEANLGDGVTDLPGWLRAGVPLAVGSDSQVTRSWAA
ncbi:MAG: amidohydrolase family protein, partial [Actinobacteria bacterium]|nr:amidohydrolase family protein [Actinomycetota bacterium]